MKPQEGISGELIDGSVIIDGKKYSAFQYDTEYKDGKEVSAWKYCKVTTRFVCGNDMIAYCANGQCYRLIETRNK